MAQKINLTDTPAEEAIARAAAVLQAGGVIVYPTDTLYGLGCLANNGDALRRIYEVKGRPAHMPLPVMIGEKSDLALLASAVIPEAWKLADVFWPGALTIIVDARKDLPLLLLGGGSSIGVRLPDSRLCNEIVKRAGFPVVTTSANQSGYPPIASVDDLAAGMSDGIDLIIDGGRREMRAPSSVVDFSGGRRILLREGGILFGRIKEVLPSLERAPGQGQPE